VSRLLPVFGEAVRRLARTYPDLHAVVPTVRAVAQTVTDAVADWPVPTIVTEDRREKHDAFAASTAALAASGTVALELGLAEVPAVVAYRVSPITAAIVRRLIRVPYVNLVNILVDRPAVPELLQEKCTADGLVAALDPLLSDPVAATAQREAGRAARARLQADGPPGRMAAQALLAGWTAGDDPDTVP
jgi:lipid-A-disaccharide synthase